MVFCLRILLPAVVLIAALGLSPVPSQSQTNIHVRRAQKTTAPKLPSKQALALFDAAEKGDTAAVQVLLDKGVSATS